FILFCLRSRANLAVTIISFESSTIGARLLKRILPFPQKMNGIHESRLYTTAQFLDHILYLSISRAVNKVIYLVCSRDCVLHIQVFDLDVIFIFNVLLIV
ncbi:hypothetical protein PENTCL1PPCAC_28412, partial [Pristionchus entomophagus]